MYLYPTETILEVECKNKNAMLIELYLQVDIAKVYHINASLVVSEMPRKWSCFLIRFVFLHIYRRFDAEIIGQQ